MYYDGTMGSYSRVEIVLYDGDEVVLSKISEIMDMVRELSEEDDSEAPIIGDGMIRLSVFECKWGSENELVNELVDVVRARGGGYDLMDGGCDNEWDPCLIKWHPGMDEPVTFRLDVNGSVMLRSSDVVATLVDEFPDAAELLRRKFRLDLLEEDESQTLAV